MNFRAKKCILLACVALAPIFLSSFAIAQDTATGSEQAEKSNAEGLGDIIVTASRRATSLQKESRIVSALGSDELRRAGVTDATSLAASVTGVTVALTGPLLQPSIRGIGDRTVTATGDQVIATSVDGVFHSRPYTASVAFYDLERVEILKGPQGTLYGRNATAGALNIITNKPNRELGGYLEGEYGNYNSKRFDGALNVPLGDSLAMRFAGHWEDRDGYLSDGYDDRNVAAGRLHILWNPSDRTSLLMSAEYSHQGGLGVASVPSPAVFSGNPWTGPTDPASLVLLTTSVPFGGLYAASLQRDGFQDVDSTQISATLEHEFDWATLTVIPAYIHGHNKSLNYASGVVAFYADTVSDSYSGEVRLSAPAGSSVEWVVGAYGSSESVHDISQANVLVNGITYSERPNLDDDNWALFAEAKAPVLDRFRVIGGLRYTYEKKTTGGFSGQAPSTPVTRLPIVATTGAPIDGSLTVRRLNWRAGFEYDVAPASMLYATVATGFKAGGFFNSAAPNTYRPEKLTAYEVGIKNRFFDDKVQFNLEAFYWDYKDRQESFVSTVLPAGVAIVTVNAASVTLKGANASLAVQVTQDDQITGEVEYLDTKYDSFVYNPVHLGPPGAPPVTGCPATAGALFDTVDCSGFGLARAPKWSGRVAYRHIQPLSNGSELELSVSGSFSSSYWLSNDFFTTLKENGYFSSDASLTWRSSENRYSITAFMKNIGDVAVYEMGTSTPFVVDVPYSRIRPPRTYGIRLRVEI